jgi:ribonuclease D
VPEPLFDTQLAAAFAGYGFSLGYAGLVKATLNTEIPKAETRSDWLARPLSAAQLKYAALDVAHMLVVYGKLLQSLKANGRLEWVRADCAELVVNARRHDDFSRTYHKVGLAWKLRPQELMVLRELCIWREIEARDSNVPRNRLAKETALWEMARKQPRDRGQLQKIADLPSRSLNDHADQLLDIIAQSAAAPESEWPPRLPFPLSLDEGPLLKQLKKTAREIAEGLDVPVEALVRKKDYEFLVRSARRGEFELPERLTGWRKPLLGEPLLAAAREYIRLHPSGSVASESSDSETSE